MNIPALLPEFWITNLVLQSMGPFWLLPLALLLVIIVLLIAIAAFNTYFRFLETLDRQVRDEIHLRKSLGRLPISAQGRLVGSRYFLVLTAEASLSYKTSFGEMIASPFSLVYLAISVGRDTELLNDDGGD